MEEERECGWGVGTKCALTVTCSLSSSLNSDIVLCILEGLTHSVDLILSGKLSQTCPEAHFTDLDASFPFPPSLPLPPPPSLHLHESSVPATQCFIFMIHDRLWKTLSDPQSLFSLWVYPQVKCLVCVINGMEGFVAPLLKWRNTAFKETVLPVYSRASHMLDKHSAVGSPCPWYSPAIS